MKVINFRATLQMLGLNASGVRNVPRDATSWMEKDEDLQEMI
jgi:hypothetical protein